MNKRYERDCANSRHHTIVDSEMRRAIEKFPQWPDDMMHAVTIIGEEYGELLKDVLQYHYEPHKNKSIETIRAEAVQTICMLHRFLNSLDSEKYVTPSLTQHQFEM